MKNFISYKFFIELYILFHENRATEYKMNAKVYGYNKSGNFRYFFCFLFNYRTQSCRSYSKANEKSFICFLPYYILF